MINTEIPLSFKFHGQDLKLAMAYDPVKTHVFSYVLRPDISSGQSKIYNFLSKRTNRRDNSLAYIELHYDQKEKRVDLTSMYVQTQAHRLMATADEIQSLRGLGKTILCHSLLMLDQHASPAEMPRDDLKVWTKVSGGSDDLLEKYKPGLPTLRQIISDSADIIQRLNIDAHELEKETKHETLALTLIKSMDATYKKHKKDGDLETPEDCITVLYSIIGNFKLLRYYERMYSFKVQGQIKDGKMVPMEADYSTLIRTCEAKQNGDPSHLVKNAKWHKGANARYEEFTKAKNAWVESHKPDPVSYNYAKRIASKYTYITQDTFDNAFNASAKWTADKLIKSKSQGYYIYYQKNRSTHWFALRGLQLLTRLYAPGIPFLGDITKVDAQTASTNKAKSVDVLVFDDAMYSGDQALVYVINCYQEIYTRGLHGNVYLNIPFATLLAFPYMARGACNRLATNSDMKSSPEVDKLAKSLPKKGSIMHNGNGSNYGNKNSNNNSNNSNSSNNNSNNNSNNIIKPEIVTLKHLSSFVSGSHQTGVVINLPPVVVHVNPIADKHIIASSKQIVQNLELPPRIFKELTEGSAWTVLNHKIPDSTSFPQKLRYGQHIYGHHGLRNPAYNVSGNYDLRNFPFDDSMYGYVGSTYFGLESDLDVENLTEAEHKKLNRKVRAHILKKMNHVPMLPLYDRKPYFSGKLPELKAYNPIKLSKPKK